MLMEIRFSMYRSQEKLDGGFMLDASIGKYHSFTQWKEH